jgi:hypothetical protein
MKKMILFSTCLLFALQGCKKTDPEMALTGIHNVSINHSSYGPDGISGTKSFSETYEGTIEISPLNKGIHVVIKSSRENKIERGLDIKNVNNDVIQYTSTSNEPGKPPPIMEYVPGTGNFSFSRSVYAGHRQSDTWVVSGKL